MVVVMVLDVLVVIDCDPIGYCWVTTVFGWMVRMWSQKSRLWGFLSGLDLWCGVLGLVWSGCVW